MLESSVFLPPEECWQDWGKNQLRRTTIGSLLLPCGWLQETWIGANNFDQHRGLPDFKLKQYHKDILQVWETFEIPRQR